MISLGLFPTNREELEICQMMVKNAAPKLKELMVCPAFSHSNPRYHELNDGALEPGLITKTIFSHLLPFKTCTAMRLKTLWLENINLRYAIKTYMKVIDFPSLEFLDIRSCIGADGLLQGMTKAVSVRGSKLTEFRINHRDDEDAEAVVALEGFLNAFSGLEALLVVLPGGSGVTAYLPKVDCIVRHKRTLNALLVVIRNEHNFIYALPDFTKITTECKELQQLAIALPLVNCIEERNLMEAPPAYDAYIVCFKVTSFPQSQRLHKYSLLCFTICCISNDCL